MVFATIYHPSNHPIPLIHRSIHIHPHPLRVGASFHIQHIVCAPFSPVQGVRIEADAYSDGSLMDEVVHLMLTVAAQVPICRGHMVCTHVVALTSGVHVCADGVSSQAPDNTDVHVVLGVLYNVSQDYDGAVECFRKVIRMPLVDPSVFSV